ncbi:class I adenylate-forming enzyme family protein [Oryzicola mucosus]|uniref:3-methylmercaptopropionyl-CoA ligase n=1 Tax=Oryzicola mucosus TaxID=2767425 RepID=A0A8J6U989_9HYPH|nr:AMP-binding protein [Oryzicola mucosus]MBD0416832.1 AMP-binding protein [Oryzicola mucosus]
MNIATWLEKTAKSSGDRPAILLGERILATYDAFLGRASALAVELCADGIAPGDRVALVAKNCPDYLVAMFGVWIAGGVIVPVNAKLHPKEAGWIIGDSEAKLVFADDAMTGDLSTHFCGPIRTIGDSLLETPVLGDCIPAHSCRADENAWLFYTSGTTGRPKGVQITHGMLTAMSLAYLNDVDDIAPDMAAYYAAPMSHGAGLYAPVHVLRGARHIVPAAAHFDPQDLLDLSGRCGPTSMFLAPTMVKRLTETAKAAGRRGEGIGTIVYGGGPMYRADIEEAVDWFGPRFVQIFGQGECPMAITALSRAEVADRTHPHWRERLAGVGRAQCAVEVAIGDADGAPLPLGSQGEIMVRGLPVMPGYWRNPEANAKTLKSGWLMTGDVGYLDADGYLTLQDRSKDVIISGGTNIYPREVEEVLLTHPCIREVSVVGRPSAEWGEDIVAFVVLSPGATLDRESLDAHCVNEIARFKRPKDYIVIETLPKNNYGKVLKTELRQKVQTPG